MLTSACRAQIGVVAVGLVFLSCIAVLGSRSFHRFHDGSRAPAFVLRDTEGQTVSLDSLHGKVVVLAFTSLSCPVSSEYCERIIQLASRHGSSGRLQVLMVDTTAENNTPHVLSELRMQRRITGQLFPTLIDRDRQLASKYQVTTTPTAIVIDPAGIVRYRGAFDDNENITLVKDHYCADAVARLLGEQLPATAYTQAFGCVLTQPK